MVKDYHASSVAADGIELAVILLICMTCNVLKMWLHSPAPLPTRLYPSNAQAPSKSFTESSFPLFALTMSSISAIWKQCPSSSSLQRSSHTVDSIEGEAYVFGGELLPRQPLRSQVFKVVLDCE